jgi:uncharacterized protein YndB with AHSA1/START domain
MPSTVTYEVHIAVPRADVWAGLRDLSRAPRYVPNLTGSEFTTDQHEGVGTSRRVFQVKGQPLDETVVEWDDGYGFKLRLHNGDKPPAPFKEGWFDYRIADAPDGGTYFRPALIYSIGGGIFGTLMDVLLVRGFARKNLRAVGENFKRHYETGEITNPAFKG